MFRHFHQSIAKSAGKDFRDGAAVPFERMWMILGSYPALSSGALALLHLSVVTQKDDVGEIEHKPLKTKQASNLEASTFTRVAQQHHHESLFQHF